MYNLNITKQYSLQPDSDWWPRCAFIREYFIGPQKIIAQQIATYLAEEFVGEEIKSLQPNTDVSFLIANAISNELKSAEAFRWLEEVRNGNDFVGPIEFRDLVRAVQTERNS